MEGFKIKNRAIRFHAGRILVYAVLYGIALFFYFFLYGYMQFVIVTILTVLPIISVASVWYLAGKCNIRMAVSENNVSRKEKFSVGILFYHHTIATSFDVKCCLRFENLFYQTKKELTVEIPIMLRGKSSMAIPLNVDRNGMIQVTATKLEISDFCGLICVVIPLECEQLVQVFPEDMELTEEEKNGFYTGISYNEEDVLKGNDFADTGNIREYVPGDRMKDIHWKLSAKKDILLVKERVRMAENRLVVLLELSGNHEQMDEILKFCYNLIQVCLKDGILVKLLWHGRETDLEEAVIGNKEGLQAAFSELYDSGINGTQECSNQTTQEISVQGGTIIRTFVRVGLQDGRAGAVVIENVG